MSGLAASSLLRASPSSTSARSSPRGAPVAARLAPRSWTSRVPPRPLCPHAVITTPANSSGTAVAHCVHIPRIQGVFPENTGLPPISTGSAFALPFSELARCSITLRPARSLAPKRDLSPECSIGVVTSADPPGGTGRSDPFPGVLICFVHCGLVAFHGALKSSG